MVEDPDEIFLQLPAGTTKTTTTEFFTDTTALKPGKVWICIGTATAMTLEVTHDGTNYCNGATFAAGDCKVLVDIISAGETYNLRQSSGSTVTLRWCKLYQ